MRLQVGSGVCGYFHTQDVLQKAEAWLAPADAEELVPWPPHSSNKREDQLARSVQQGSGRGLEGSGRGDVLAENPVGRHRQWKQLKSRETQLQIVEQRSKLRLHQLRSVKVNPWGQDCC